MTDLIEELQDVSRRIGRMCSELRPPSMSIPVRPCDDDIFITKVVNEATSELTRLRDREKVMREALEWRGIDSAPKDGSIILVHYDHNAGSYYNDTTGKLSDYAANAEGGDFLDGVGVTLARWRWGYWDGNEMAGEPRTYIPGAWFAWFNSDTQYACNPTHWLPLPPPPALAGQKEG